jgi:hypothetical protein
VFPNPLNKTHEVFDSPLEETQEVLSAYRSVTYSILDLRLLLALFRLLIFICHPILMHYGFSSSHSHPSFGTLLQTVSKLVIAQEARLLRSCLVPSIPSHGAIADESDRPHNKEFLAEDSQILNL